MFRFHQWIFILSISLVIFVRNEVYADPSVDAAIEEIVRRLFSLWTLPCSEWIRVFSEDSIWYHPKFPNAIEYSQLLDFCQVNQKTRPALFRQDGEIRVTMSGSANQSALYHLMVPYVYGQIENENRNSLFINSGYEYILLSQNNQQQFRIEEVVEFFNRASLPFVWPPNN